MDSAHTDMNSLPQVLVNDQLYPVDVRTNSVIVPMRIPLESVSLPSRQQPTGSPRYLSDKPANQLPWSRQQPTGSPRYLSDKPANQLPWTKKPQTCRDKKKKNEVNPFRLFEPSQPTRPRLSRVRRKSTRINQKSSPGIHVEAPMGIMKHLQLADPPASVPPTATTTYFTNPVQTARQPRRGFRRLKPYLKSDPFTIHKLPSNQKSISHQGQLEGSPGRIFNQVPCTISNVPTTFVPVNQEASQIFERENKAASYHTIQTHLEKAAEFENRNLFSVKSGYGSDTYGFESNFLLTKAPPYCHGIPPAAVAPVLPSPKQPTERTTISQHWKAPPVYPFSEWESVAPPVYPYEWEHVAPPFCPSTERENVTLSIYPSTELNRVATSGLPHDCQDLAPPVYPFTTCGCAPLPGYPATKQWEHQVPSVYSQDEYKPVVPTGPSAEWGGFPPLVYSYAERPVSGATYQTTAENMCVRDQIINVITDVRKESLTSSSHCSRPIPRAAEQSSSDLDLSEATSMALIVVAMGNGSFMADDIFLDEYRSVRCELDSIVEEPRLKEACRIAEHDVNDGGIEGVHDDTGSQSESSIDSDVDVDSDNRSDACSTSWPWRRNVAGSLRWEKGRQHDPVAIGRKCYRGTLGDLDVPLTTVDHTVDYILGLDCPLPQFVEP